MSQLRPKDEDGFINTLEFSLKGQRPYVRGIDIVRSFQLATGITAARFVFRKSLRFQARLVEGQDPNAATHIETAAGARFSLVATDNRAKRSTAEPPPMHSTFLVRLGSLYVLASPRPMCVVDMIDHFFERVQQYMPSRHIVTAIQFHPLTTPYICFIWSRLQRGADMERLALATSRGLAAQIEFQVFKRPGRTGAAKGRR